MLMQGRSTQVVLDEIALPDVSSDAQHDNADTVCVILKMVGRESCHVSTPTASASIADINEASFCNIQFRLLLLLYSLRSSISPFLPPFLTPWVSKKLSRDAVRSLYMPPHRYAVPQISSQPGRHANASLCFILYMFNAQINISPTPAIPPPIPPPPLPQRTIKLPLSQFYIHRIMRPARPVPKGILPLHPHLVPGLFHPVSKIFRAVPAGIQL